MYALISVSRTVAFDVEIGVICKRETFDEANEAMRKYADNYMSELDLEPCEREELMPKEGDNEWTYSDLVDWYEKVKIVSI